MNLKFIDRESELKYLNSEYYREGSALVIIYGRRRIGKTSLIKKFLDDKTGIYYLASEEMESENINLFKKLVANFTDNSLLIKGSDFSWDDIFKVLGEYKKNEKIVIVIDEFQYLSKMNSAFPSIFQRIWDQILKDKNVMVILCGSLISMMESQTLAYSSPLYGRRTGQIKMQQISFLNYHEFYVNKTQKELIEFYAVTGGVPKYIEAFANEENIYTAIEKNILSRRSFLYEEPVFLLTNEVSEIGSYFSIIKTIAQGDHKLGHISSKLGVSQPGLTKYLSTLINMDLIERQIPITETNPEKSKKGLYFIKDNFICFWFRFIYPYRNYIEMDDITFVINKIKDNFIQKHVSFIYEKICMERMWRLNKENNLPFRFDRLGRWWNNSEEIDIVGLNEDSKEIVFCECKYYTKKVDVDVFYSLLQKAKQVGWQVNGRKEYYIIFSNSGFTNNLLELANKRNDILLLT